MFPSRDDAPHSLPRLYAATSGGLTHAGLAGYYAWFGLGEIAVINVASVALWCGCVVLLWLGRPKVSVWLMMLEATVHVVAFGTYFGALGGYLNFLPAIVIAPFLLFERTYRRHTWLLLGVGLVAALTTWSVAPTSGPLSPETVEIVARIGAVNFVVALLSVGAIIYYFIRGLEQAEDRLQEERSDKEAALIREKEQAEAFALARSQLVEAEKQAAVGRLVAGILHETNTPLGVLQSAADTFRTIMERCRLYVESRSEEDAGAQSVRRAIGVGSDVVKTVEESSTRIAATVDNLKQFVAFDEADRQVIDVRESIDSALGILGSEEERERIRKNIAPAAMVECYPSKLNRAFLTLIQNALDASETGEVSIQLTTREGEVEAQIADHGPGIPEEVLSGIFEFGFTKKATGERIGLRIGLPTCKRTIDEIGGRIWIDSTVGVGTTVHIRLLS